MNSDEATVAVIDALQSLDIPYILVGSLASNLYGIPGRPRTPISACRWRPAVFVPSLNV